MYPAAIFRILGIPVAQSYALYMILINFLTFLTSYHFFFKLNKNTEAIFLFSLLYTLSAYRLCDVITRGALGETLSFIFLPVGLYGLIELVRGDREKYFFHSIGMAGLFYAHLLSTIIFTLFIALYLIMNWKCFKKEKQRFLSLAYSILLTIGLAGMTIFPMLEQLMFQKLNVQDKPIFFLKPRAPNIIDYFSSAVKHTGHNNLGLFAFFAMFILIISFKKLTKNSKQLLILSILFLFLATNYFPHELFHSTWLNAIQFPWRYFSIVTLCISWVFSESWNRIADRKVDVGLVVIAILLTLSNTILYQLNREDWRRYDYAYYEKPNPADLGIGMEYLPINIDYERYIYNPHNMRADSEKIELSNMKRTHAEISLDYNAPEETELTFPLIYYKGYQIEATGDSLVKGIQNSHSNVGLNAVVVKGKGHLKIFYKGTWIQTISRAVSLSCWLFLIVVWVSKWRGSKR